MRRLLIALAFALSPVSAFAAEAITGPVQQRPVDYAAIFMFVVFVLATLVITKWAAQRTRTAKDFYAAGGGITGFQNGLAIAGDYMSAASFLGISGLVYLQGYRRADLLDRLSRRLADHPVPDRRAPAQSRQVHLRRRRLLPAAAERRSARSRLGALAHRRRSI